MFTRVMTVLLFAVVLAGCATPGPFQTTVYPQSDTWSGVVTVRFVDSQFDVGRRCQNEGSAMKGCAYSRKDSCRVIMARPDGFEDVDGMVTLGHEIYHCTGARH